MEKKKHVLRSLWTSQKWRLEVDNIKPLDPVSATAEPQQSMKELRLDEIEERLKQKMKSSDTIKNNENSKRGLENYFWNPYNDKEGNGLYWEDGK